MPVRTPRSFSIVRPRLAAVMTDDQRRELMQEFINEVAGADTDLKVTMEWSLETWLQWLKKRQEKTDGKRSNQGATGADRGEGLD